MTLESPKAMIIRKLFKALEAGDEPEVLGELYGADAVQLEFPNRVTPRGASRTIDQMKEAMVRGRQVIRSQRYDVLRLFEVGTTAIVEARWSAELANPPPGAPSSMAASFAVFFEFSGEKIAAQRNYDCFDPP